MLAQLLQALGNTPHPDSLPFWERGAKKEDAFALPPAETREGENNREAAPLPPLPLPLVGEEGGWGVGEGHGLVAFPPADRWDDWTEYDGKAWPKRVARRYTLVPTVCFNCESGCGLMGYVDRDTLRVQKFEGNPAHPGSRGRSCDST